MIGRLSLPLHAVSNQIFSISILLLIGQQPVSQQTLGLILKGGQVSPWAGGVISPPGGPARAGHGIG